MSNLVIFDLDGVITSEDCYWDAAGLTLHELCYNPRYWNIDRRVGTYQPVQSAEESRRVSRSTLPEAEILTFKAHAINSNWDTCYAGVCLRLIDLLAQLQDISTLLPLQPWEEKWLANFREKWQQVQLSHGGETRRGGGGGDAGRGPLWPPAEREKTEEEPRRGGGGGDVGRGPLWPPAEREKTERIEKEDENDGRPQGSPLHPSLPAPLSEPSLWRLSGDNYASLFDASVFQGYVGLELINRFDAYASQVLGHSIEGVFSRYSPFWTFCQDIFQAWFLGDELYTEVYGREPEQKGKPGCIHFERPLLPVEHIQTALKALREQGYVLGFATGRTYREAAYPLNMYGLLSYFDEAHIAPYDYVERAEAELRKYGDATLLGKPNPFQFLVTFDQSYEYRDVRDEKSAVLKPFVVVGDSTSDILGGRAAGAITVAVLTGARTPQARQLLAQSGPDFTLDDITQVPSLLKHMDSLATIQKMQFTEREKAERLLRWWFARHMNLQVKRVTLTPKAVSLNSFNGFYSANGEEYFFKTHVEEQGVLEEYYHAELLEQAGYNVVRPLKALREEGRQMVVYPVVRWPVMFDLMRAVETGKAEEGTLETLVAAEQRECERLLDIYAKTLAFSSAEEHARAPIHQLFWHRLAGERYQSFYAGKAVPLPDSSRLRTEISFEELLRCRWTIYAKEAGEMRERRLPLTLGELVEQAQVVLKPEREGMTSVGHGDAHFGNIFLEEQTGYLYFDPAFAGRHTPLLDVVKPLFHNVFATWMYFPEEVAQDLHISVKVKDTHIYVEHDYALTPVRQAILTTKIEALLKPLQHMLSSRNALPDDWADVLRLALMCCPLLTINLLDKRRMSAEICWLGLVQVMQMGHFPSERE